MRQLFQSHCSPDQWFATSTSICFPTPFLLHTDDRHGFMTLCVCVSNGGLVYVSPSLVESNLPGWAHKSRWGMEMVMKTVCNTCVWVCVWACGSFTKLIPVGSGRRACLLRCYICFVWRQHSVSVFVHDMTDVSHPPLYGLPFPPHSRIRPQGASFKMNSDLGN